MRRKPTLTKLNEGDAARRGKHVLEAKLAAEPKVQSGLPPCPDRLRGDARLIYEHFRQQLELSGLDKTCDAFALWDKLLQPRPAKDFKTPAN